MCFYARVHASPPPPHDARPTSSPRHFNFCRGSTQQRKRTQQQRDVDVQWTTLPRLEFEFDVVNSRRLRFLHKQANHFPTCSGAQASPFLGEALYPLARRCIACAVDVSMLCFSPEERRLLTFFFCCTHRFPRDRSPKEKINVPTSFFFELSSLIFPGIVVMPKQHKYAYIRTWNTRLIAYPLEGQKTEQRWPQSDFVCCDSAITPHNPVFSRSMATSLGRNETTKLLFHNAPSKLTWFARFVCIFAEAEIQQDVRHLP